ncbi:hypothetical protein JCM8202_000236 [Rhodotorula sphaerocarpa]
MAQPEQALLYALRSTTTPLADKVQRAADALDAAPDSAALPTLVRDWALDILLKSTRIPSLAPALSDAALWAVIARTTAACSPLTIVTPTLAVLVAFVGLYSEGGASAETLPSVAATWARIAPSAMRKATVDGGLESYDKLVAASLSFHAPAAGRTPEEVADWAVLGASWLAALRTVVLDAGKGGKKVPSHTLSLLPNLLPLLCLLADSSPFRAALLQTVQVALFNVDNLRRGLARESYTAGAASTGETTLSTVDTELFAAFKTLPAEAIASARAALPALTRLYFGALAAHSAVLFPLPAKSNFPTPSAHKSALEVLGLTRRRELAGRWNGGVLEYLAWSPDPAKADRAEDVEAATALAGVLQEVEAHDLYRPGQATQAWNGIFPAIAGGAVDRLADCQRSDLREAVLRVLDLCARLAFKELQPFLPRIFASLAHVGQESASSPAASSFLHFCIEYHSRSLMVTTLLELVSTAVASAYTDGIDNSLLTTTAVFDDIGTAVAGAAGSASALHSTWAALVGPVRSALNPEAEVEASGPTDTGSEGPAKKRKLASDAAPADRLAAAGHTRIAALYLRHVPDASLSTLAPLVREFADDTIDDAVKAFAEAYQDAAVSSGSGDSTPAKKAKKSSRRKSNAPQHEALSSSELTVLGAELLELRYVAVERLRRSELLTKDGNEGDADWWLLRGKRREALRAVVTSGSGAEVVIAARALLQYAETVGPEVEATKNGQATFACVLARLLQTSKDTVWNGTARRLPVESVGVALYETLARRWLALFSAIATEDQLADFSHFFVDNLDGADASVSGITTQSITHALARRSEVWELTRLRAEDVLDAVSGTVKASKADEARRSLEAQTLLATAKLFRAIGERIPSEYLDMATKGSLADSALALDLWLSSEHGISAEADRASAQSDLRHFVVTPALASRLVASTSDSARDVTVALCRKLVFAPAIAVSKTDASAQALLRVADELAKNPLAVTMRTSSAGSGAAAVSSSASDFALLSFFESIARSFNDKSSVPTSAWPAVEKLITEASAHVASLVPSLVRSIETSPSSIITFHDALHAIRIVWLVDVQFGASGKTTDYSAFVQSVLQCGLSQLPALGSAPGAADIARDLMGLASLQASSARDESSRPSEAAGGPLQSVLALQLAFQAALPRTAWHELDRTLLDTVSTSSETEYDGALKTIASLMTTCATSDLSSAETAGLLDQLLHTATNLLLSGPEGSGRVASAAFADILRDATVLASRVSSEDGAPASYFAISRFLDVVCGERPLLLSRLNVSAVLSLVSICLRPESADATVSSQVAGETFRNLVSTIGHIVRHRKDHLVSLFPALVAVLTGILSILRIGGLGSLGQTNSLDDSAETLGPLGQRAEREAKGTFPPWIWAGGRQAIGRPEAKAVSRLLGSLGAKTAATSGGGSGSSKRRSTAIDGSASTVSLIAPLSKHAPFLLLSYLRACVHPTCPIPSKVRSELQGGWFEVMDAMGKWEREALMKGMLGDEEEAERGVLRDMWSAWEKERYRG